MFNYPTGDPFLRQVHDVHTLRADKISFNQGIALNRKHVCGVVERNNIWGSAEAWRNRKMSVADRYPAVDVEQNKNWKRGGTPSLGVAVTPFRSISTLVLCPGFNKDKMNSEFLLIFLFDDGTV